MSLGIVLAPLSQWPPAVLPTVPRFFPAHRSLPLPPIATSRLLCSSPWLAFHSSQRSNPSIPSPWGSAPAPRQTNSTDSGELRIEGLETEGQWSLSPPGGRFSRSLSGPRGCVLDGEHILLPTPLCPPHWARAASCSLFSLSSWCWKLAQRHVFMDF